MIITTRPNENDILVYDLFIGKGTDEAFEVEMNESSINNLGVEVLTPVPFVSGDKVIFTVKDSKGNLIILKTITVFTEDGTAPISLLPSDTSQQKALTYKYDVIGETAAYGKIILMHTANFEIESTVGDF